MNIETIEVGKLKPHPRNYKEHPEQQLEHIIKSIEEHGFYRNIVVAKDNTILAGHGVVQASKLMGKQKVPVIRLDIDSDSTQALKVLTSDNEIGNLAMVDDRQLSEVLKDILDEELDLTGTGFNEDQLSALIYTTRNADEIQTIDEANEWVGIADYENKPDSIKVMVHFDTEEDRENFMQLLDNPHVNYKMGKTWKIWYPERSNEDPSSIRFEHG
jgi:hypothetical protein